MSKQNDLEIEKALRALVLADGRVSKAHERLLAAGEDVPERTLRHWRDTHADRYSELRASRTDWVAEQMAAASEFIAAGYAEGEAKMLAVLLSMPETKLREMSPNVLAQAARNLSIARGVSIDKANDLRQRPTRPDGTAQSLTDALKALQTRFSHVVKVNPAVIESSAEEIE
jgi:hypothetical protein